MHSTRTDDATDQRTRPWSRGRGSLIVLLTLLLVFLLIAFLPPLVNVSRFQKRIASNISTALGRPVHFDSVSLTMLPLPGFTLKTFVIDEDPAFGFEPVLRADEVQVTLRISSLWHPHVEFSKIAFTEPSVNLVRSPDGKWNIESLLLQASHLQAAPTSQRFAGPARRFPYIEATGARLNLKLDQEKTPVSLTDADFALWLPEPHQWHLRLEAHPTRTDTSPGDTGTLRAEGTLGGADVNAASLAQIPIDLHGDWRNAQLGGVGRLLLGRDPELRGDFSLIFAIAGTVGRNSIAVDLKLAKARRADFVPSHMLALDAACKAIAGETFHSFTSIECRWPPAESSDPNILSLAASLPDVRNLDSVSASITLPALPSETLSDWLSVASPHPPTILAGSGVLAANLNWGLPSVPVNEGRPRPKLSPTPSLSGEVELSGSSIETDPLTHRSVPLGTVVIRSTPTSSNQPSRSRAFRAALPNVQIEFRPSSFDLLPVSLALGGKQPAIMDGHFDPAGYTLHLTGIVVAGNLLEMANAVPQFGDGLEVVLDKIAATTPDPDAKPATMDKAASASSEIAAGPVLSTAPIHIDLTATRVWGGLQTWRQTTPAPTVSGHHSSK
jgi:hypothetical protein